MNALDDREKKLERVMARHNYSGSALVEVLHTAQELYGYLSKPIMKTIARKLSIPPSNVLGVATFYHLFKFAPPREHTAVICLGTACYAAGGMDLMHAAEHKCDRNQWTVASARCVGSCGLAPVVICDDRALGRVTSSELESMVEAPVKA